MFACTEAALRKFFETDSSKLAVHETQVAEIMSAEDGHAISSCTIKDYFDYLNR
jgi:hypothetical protein